MEENSLKYRPVGWTTYRDAKELVKLGLDPRSADMMYLDINYEDDLINRVMPTPIVAYTNEYVLDEDVIPCWSLGRLIELLPTQTGECSDVKLYKRSNDYVTSFLTNVRYDFIDKKIIESVIASIIHLLFNYKYLIERSVKRILDERRNYVE